MCVFIIIGICFEIYGRFTDDGKGMLYVIPSFGSYMIALIFFSFYMSTIKLNVEAELYIQQKEYIESYEPEDEAEKTALMSKKLELNTWLYNVCKVLEYNENWVRPVDVIFTLEEIE